MSEPVSLKTPQHFNRLKQILSIAGLVGLSLVTLGLGQKLVNAEESLTESNSLAIANLQPTTSNIQFQEHFSPPDAKNDNSIDNSANIHRIEQIEQIAFANNWRNASFPVENFEGYTSAFGPRSGGFHYGLDLAAPSGSYIRNWWGGKVVEVWEDSRCGTGIAIKSGNWEHIYCHVQGGVGKSNGRNYFMDRSGGIILWEGQQLAAGARIARVGMTGRTTGPHLHWGLKYGGRWVDPGLILREMYAQQSRSLSSNR